MLRFRSKRPEWESRDLPVSTSSSSSLSEKPQADSHVLTCQDNSGLLHETQRFAKILLTLLALVLSLLILYSVSLLHAPTGRHGVQSHTPKSYVNVTRDIPSKSKILLRGKLPLVERSILDKLALLDQSTESENLDELLHLISTTVTPAWPPVVTRIPEARLPSLASNLLQHQFQHEPISKASPAEFDFSICGAETCRFILPLRIAEQESKARLHFLQILELAGRLNRIVVLPNVGKSRMGSCFKWDFGKYYDAKELSGGGRVIDMETFRRWTATRPVKPSSQIMSIEPKSLTGALSGPSLFSINGITVKIEDDQDPSDPKHVRCLKSKFPRLCLGAFSALSIHPSKWVKQRPFGPAVVDALEKDHIQSASFRGSEDQSLEEADLQQQNYDQKVNIATSAEPDVMILNYDLRHPIFPTSQILSYSPVLSAFATDLLTPLEPQDYLVIHWRMETVPLDVLSSCAEALISTLTDLLQGQDGKTIKTVWFASDYPYPVSRPSLQRHHRSTQKDGASKSGTFRAVGLQHEEAIDILRNAFSEGGPLEGRRITGLAEELARIRTAARNAQTRITIEGELLEDSGVLGILDKIVAMQAGLFVSGGKGCGRVSSFTKQIVDTRDAVMMTEGKQIRNVVKYFG